MCSCNGFSSSLHLRIPIPIPIPVPSNERLSPRDSGPSSGISARPGATDLCINRDLLPPRARSPRFPSLPTFVNFSPSPCYTIPVRAKHTAELREFDRLSLGIDTHQSPMVPRHSTQAPCPIVTSSHFPPTHLSILPQTPRGGIFAIPPWLQTNPSGNLEGILETSRSNTPAEMV